MMTMEKYYVIILLVCLLSSLDAKLPEEEMTVPQMIQYWGYPVEIHEATTSDRYILTLHRIPHGRKYPQRKSNRTRRPVVFLQHGLLCSSADWVMNFPDDSLGFMLADNGFDVWMGNVRGNTYSRKHEYLSEYSSSFWDFTFNEMGSYDLPAMIQYVLQTSHEEELYYVGHSQGTMMTFIGLPEHKRLQKSIKMVFALAPVTRLKNIYSPIKYLAWLDFGSIFKVMLDVFGIHQFLPSMAMLHKTADVVCPITPSVCKLAVIIIAGYDTDDLNKTRLPVYFGHVPAGTSIKNMQHFGQLSSSGIFRKYDYGFFRNAIRYGSLWPPRYQFELITTPFVIIGGANDWLSPPADYLWTATQLLNTMRVITIPGYNHFDFLWGLSAKNKVYKPIIEMIKHSERR